MNEARNLFEKDLSPLSLKASQSLIDSLEKAYVQSKQPLFNFLEDQLHSLKADIVRKQLIFSTFEEKYKTVTSEEAHRLITLDFAKELGASPKELKQDKKAFSRWFDFYAVADRCRYQISSMESKLGFIIDRLSLLLLSDPSRSKEPLLLLLTDWAQTYPGNQRIKVKVLEAILKLITPDIVLDKEVFHYLSLSDQKDVWIQSNAISILKRLDPSLFHEVATKRLGTYGTDPDFFVRQHITALLEQEDIAINPSFLAHIHNDPSEFVRQTLCQKIAFLPQGIVSQLLEDSSPQVRASALLNIMSMCSFKERCDRLLDRCTHELDPFVLRVCLKCIKDGFSDLKPDEQKKWFSTFEPILDQLHTSNPYIPIRRRAAQTREELWCAKNPHLLETKEKITSLLINIKPGTGSFLPYSLFAGLKEEEIGRLLSLITQLDFGCELKKTNKGYKIFRGVRLKFRLWRFLHEFFHPKTEKREAVRHTIGRWFQGEIQVPSAILAELSQTQVPGEPLYLPEEGGYRPYLPLVDHMLSIAQKNRPFLFYTSEGITTITPPPNLLSRLKAKAHITLYFSSLAERRNWRDDSFWKPSQYVKTWESLGFKLDFRSYDDTGAQDSAVTRFFPAFILLPDWDPFVSSILSSSKSSILALSFFLLILCLYFFLVHIRNFLRLKTARGSLPLVIGGWGTRGKSSTDRLKSALINGMGFGVFAKTTGCEAVLTFAGPYQKMHEVPYYRSYGKVTIWEQARATFLARKFKTDIMLWECMALRPDYVKIIQQQWMKSDLSTLTNAYPDHEDFQGPAGYNIAEALPSFIVPHSQLLTAEEQMLPYLQADALEKDTKLQSVGWLEEGLLTNDVLDRFPYREHPQNIMLIMEMAKLLNVSTSFVLKEIADEVLPDIGALKVYPIASLKDRSLEFVNGMSANEEYTCLTNWHHLGFDQAPLPGIWISTLINNRADRVGRSRIFAQLVVHNINAEKHFVVGSNLNGFMNFVHKAWDEFLSTLPFDNNSQELLENFAHKLRICFTLEELESRLASMGVKGFKEDLLDLQKLKIFLNTQGHSAPEAVLRFHEENIKMFQEYKAISQQLVTKLDENKFKDTLTKWFLSKFILLDKNTPSGDEMISWICDHTPPYYLNKIMGIQNIKGPGLEFVYRWQAWEKCSQAGKLLLNPIPQKVLQGFRNLRFLSEFGILSQVYLEELFPQINAKYKTEIQELKNHIETIRKSAKTPKKQNFFIRLILGFFRINISYHQTKRANKIYDDLINKRISYFRAQEELEKLVRISGKE